MRICEWRYDADRYPSLRTYYYWMDEVRQVWCHPEYGDEREPVQDYAAAIREDELNRTELLTRVDLIDPLARVVEGL